MIIPRRASLRFAISASALILLALLSFACFAIPMYVIRPFRAQGARELAVALKVREYGPAVSLVCALLCAGLVFLVWRRTSRRLARVGFALCLFIAALGAGLSRINVYELMFHPAGAPGFEPAAQAKVDADDMVLAVRLGSDARAYPIREMAYHHVVNDVVAGVPIAATY